MFLIQVKFSCRRDKKIFFSEFIFLVLRKIFQYFLDLRTNFSVSFEGFAVCSINFEPPDNDLCSACHVYPLSRGAWIISILFPLNGFTLGGRIA